MADPSAAPTAKTRFSDIAAILVLFDSRSDPRNVVVKLAGCVGTVVIVDNVPEGHPLSPSLSSQFGARVLHNGNLGGLAGGYNAALRYLESHELGWTHVVFVDDDSDPGILTAFLGDEVNAQALDKRSTAALSPVYRDRATGLRGAHIVLGRFRIRHLPREQRGLVQVSFVINSMSIWRRAALRTIGDFNEGLAVDHVDTEYCARARLSGFSVFINGNYEFAHSIGERRRFSLFGVGLQSGGHAPQRRFSIARNTVWLARKYMLAWPAFSLLCVIRLGYEIAGVILAESDKSKKLAALVKGTIQGLRTHVPES